MSKSMKQKYDVGVIIARFQVAEFTQAHRTLIDEVFDNHKQVIIMLGVSETLGEKKNPLSYAARVKMVQSEYPSAIITPILDMSSDIEWSKSVDRTVRALSPIGSVCLYGGQDSFISHYSGIYPTFELAPIGDKHAVSLREEIGKEIIDSVDFRKGIIHSCQNQYPRVYPTADIAIIKRDDGLRVLMGKRHGLDKFRFFGGFVSPSDKNIEYTAIREAIEEVDVKFHITLTYICSSLIDDWRYQGPDEKIMTTFFMTDYISGSGSPRRQSETGDTEFSETEWIEIRERNFGLIEECHKPLFRALVDKYFPNSNGLPVLKKKFEGLKRKSPQDELISKESV